MDHHKGGCQRKDQGTQGGCVGFGLSHQRNTNCAEWPNDLHSTVIGGLWDLGSLMNETPIALSGWMVRTAEGLVLCGISAFLSMKHQLP